MGSSSFVKEWRWDSYGSIILKRSEQLKFQTVQGPEIRREASPHRLHSTWDMNMLQFSIDSEVSWEERPCIRNINSGQSSYVDN